MGFDFTDPNIAKVKEDFKSKTPGDGKRGPFYNGTLEWEFDIKNSQLFEDAVWQGYLDASRTFDKIKDTKNKPDAFIRLAGSIQKYFDGDEAFDHSKWCNAFINGIRENNSYEATYGQAQKVVNMAFKYLYCCDGAKNYAEKFASCHMPLDTITLLWFFSKTGKYYEGWSYFTEESYNEVQSQIMKIIKNNILDKELVIWEQLKKGYVDLKKRHREVTT